MVFDPEGNIPRVRDATYYYSKAEAIESAMTSTRPSEVTGRAPIKFVQPGKEEERVFVDEDTCISYIRLISLLRRFWQICILAKAALLGRILGTSLVPVKKRPGLFRVVDPGMGIPGIHDAVYWYTQEEAIACAIHIWNAGSRMGGPLVDYVQPGNEIKHIFVDYTRLREESPNPLQVHLRGVEGLAKPLCLWKD